VWTSRILKGRKCHVSKIYNLFAHDSLLSSGPKSNGWWRRARGVRVREIKTPKGSGKPQLPYSPLTAHRGASTPQSSPHCLREKIHISYQVISIG
jgi:hypothetical protein